MNLTIFFDHLFLRDRAGRHYTRATFDAVFWQRYLEVFETVTVVTRVQPVDAAPAGVSLADTEQVRFAELPAYVGPWGYLRTWPAIRRRVKAELAKAEAVLFRVPSTIGTLAWQFVRKQNRSFALEVVADPWETLGPGTTRDVLRPFARRRFARAMRRQCREAYAAAYVTRTALQRRYPPGNPERSTYYSSIDLNPQDIRTAPRDDFDAARRLVFVGTLEVFYKAPDVLAEALALCNRRDLHLTYVGDGRRRGDLEQLVRRLGLEQQVTFAGRLPGGAAVRDVLDESHLFVLPSRQEGVPRAMIEAMARGLPCVGSTAGGIPELLEPAHLVPVGDANALARKIIEVLDDPDGLHSASRRNLDTAREYGRDRLGARRRAFYESIRAANR